MMNNKLGLILAQTVQGAASAVQGAAANVEMADGLRANGKIYVVVTVVGIVLLGLITYLILLDNKIEKIEKSLKEKQ